MTPVNEIMSSDVLSIPPTAPVLDALRMMSSTGLRHLPVVEKGRLVGILSDHDVHPFEGPEGVSNDVVLRHLNAPVSESMTRDPETVATTASLDQAARLMIDAKIGALPVVDGGKLMGILSTLDVLRWVRDHGKLD
jgi:acetoin utilization protein AcuB